MAVRPMLAKIGQTTCTAIIVEIQLRIITGDDLKFLLLTIKANEANMDPRVWNIFGLVQFIKNCWTSESVLKMKNFNFIKNPNTKNATPIQKNTFQSEGFGMVGG